MIKHLAAVAAIAVVTLTGFASQAQADSVPRDDTDGRARVVCIPNLSDYQFPGPETAYMAWSDAIIDGCQAVID